MSRLHDKKESSTRGETCHPLRRRVRAYAKTFPAIHIASLWSIQCAWHVSRLIIPSHIYFRNFTVNCASRLIEVINQKTNDFVMQVAVKDNLYTNLIVSCC